MRTWILLALAISQGAWALAPCERQSQVGSWCEANIAALHPTQGAWARSRSTTPRPS